VWVAVLFYAVVNLGFLFAVGGIMGSSGAEGKREFAGCLTHVVGAPILQGATIGVVVAFLLPIILGFGGTTSVSLLAANLKGIALAGVIGVVVSILVSLVPIIGTFVSQPGVQSFIVGLVVFRILSDGAIGVLLERAGRPDAAVYPSLWLTLGYLVIASVLVYGTALALVFVQAKRDREPETLSETLTVVGGMSLGFLAGLIPLLMYGQYVGLSLRRL
jgi:hypothetical protein